MAAHSGAFRNLSWEGSSGAWGKGSICESVEPELDSSGMPILITSAPKNFLLICEWGRGGGYDLQTYPLVTLTHCMHNTVLLFFHCLAMEYSIFHVHVLNLQMKAVRQQLHSTSNVMLEHSFHSQPMTLAFNVRIIETPWYDTSMTQQCGNYAFLDYFYEEKKCHLMLHVYFV